MNTGETSNGARFIRVFFLLALLLVSSVRALAQDAGSLLTAYLDARWRAAPVAASGAGVHTYDARMPDLSALAFASAIARDRDYLQRFNQLSAASMSLDQRVNRDIVAAWLRATLIDTAETEWWKKRPDRYAVLLDEAVRDLAFREFAPAEKRFSAVAARLKLFPRATRDARANLQETPELARHDALETLHRLADFLDKQLAPMAAEQGASKKTQSRVQREIAPASAAVRELARSLQALPARGSGVLEAAVYARWFADYLGAARTPDEWLARAEADLHRIEGAMQQLAGEIAPGRNAREVLDGLAGDHAKPARLPAAYRTASADLKKFASQHKLAPVPSPDRVRIALDTSDLSRRAYLQPPGPFEPDTPWYFHVPVPDQMSFEAGEAALRANNTFAVPLVVARELYPGRYAQLDAAYRTPNLARKVFASAAFVEGWTLYAERLVIDQGALTDSRNRLTELRDEARAASQAVADIRLHTGRLDAAAAGGFLAEHGFYAKDEAERLAADITLHPARHAARYVGKIELDELREEMRKKQGPAFTLPEFHEALLTLGAPPVPLARDLLFAAEPTPRLSH